jgi:glycosyltransferase involved in cell wall biosynthesis
VVVKIIIVDDGSKDNTAKVGFEYVKKYTLDVVRVLKQVVNQGKGAAVRKVVFMSILQPSLHVNINVARFENLIIVKL